MKRQGWSVRPSVGLMPGTKDANISKVRQPIILMFQKWHPWKNVIANFQSLSLLPKTGESGDMSPKLTKGRISAIVADRDLNFSRMDSTFRGTKTVEYMLLEILPPYLRNSRWPPDAILI